MHTIIKGIKAYLQQSLAWIPSYATNTNTEYGLLLLTNLLLNGQNNMQNVGSNQGPIHLYI